MVSILLVLLIGCSFVGGAAYSALRAGATPGNKKWAEAIGYALLAVGGLGFFGMMLSAMGGLRLPSTFEWPVGNARGILVMPNGERVVPLKAAGRIQIYDPAWHFLRGWHVDAGGGPFILRLDDSIRIKVLTARGQKQYVYGLDGRLFSQESYAPQRYSDYYAAGESTSVPTRWWLWMLTNPIHSWIIAALGGGLLFLCAWKAKNKVA